MNACSGAFVAAASARVHPGQHDEHADPALGRGRHADDGGAKERRQRGEGEKGDLGVHGPSPGRPHLRFWRAMP